MDLVKKCKLKEFWTEVINGQTLVCFKLWRGVRYEIKRYTFQELAAESNRKLKRRKTKPAAPTIIQLPG